MKKSFLFLLIAFTGNLLCAQTITPVDNYHPLKFNDLLSEYKKYETENNEPKQVSNEDQEDGMNNLFSRRIWAAKRHLDENGYIVPPLKTINEWEQYKTNHANAKSRTTGSLPANWTFEGPSFSATSSAISNLGRINIVTFDPVDSNTFYIGSAAGGAWKTTDGGKTWTCLYSFLPSIGVADIKVNPLNHNTIYVVTGDGDGFDSYGAGVIVSYDGGSTWANTSLMWTPAISQRALSLIINPVDTNCLLVATTSGIYKSNNGGSTWTIVDTRICKQLMYNPADTAIAYGTTMNSWDPWFSTEAQIIRTINGGLTWDSVTTFTGTERINLAVTPANPAIVKAIISNTANGLYGIYGSVDAGATFFAIYTDDIACTQNLLGHDPTLPTIACGGQGAYDLCIAIDPGNVNNVMIGGVYTFASTDGGITWQIANDAGEIAGVPALHPDKHFLAWNPLSGALFETNDGGIDKTYFPLTGPWTDLTRGLGITEFYNNAVDNGVTTCLGGAQDNGSMLLSGGGLTYLPGGDGFEVLYNYGDPANIFYLSYAFGEVLMTRDGGTTFVSISDILHTTGTWNTPYALHPRDTATLVLAYKNVYASYNNGTSWTSISPVFDTSDYITVMAMSAKNPDYIYTSYDDYYVTGKSVIHYTTNFGSTWNTISFPYILAYITDLVVDPKNENHFLVTLSGATAGTKVYSYDITTGAWTNESGSLPNIPIYCMAIDTFSGTQYIGTETSIFYKTTAMADWALYNTNLPTVWVNDLHINYGTGEIWAATFGRGMWKSIKNDTPAHTNTHTYVPVTNPDVQSVTISPNPAHNTFMINTASAQLRQGEVTIKLVTADGKTVWNNTGTFDNTGKLKINTRGLPGGFYICEVSNKNNNVIARNKVVIY